MARPQSPSNEFLWKNVRTSAIAHAILLVLSIIACLTFNKEPIRFIPSIRVDLVALPDIKKSDLNKYTPSDMKELDEKLKKVEKSAKKTLETLKEKEEVKDFSPKKKRLKDAIDRIKALTEIENEVKNSASKPKQVAKGNILSKGNALTGPQNGDVNSYIGTMQTKLRENWNLPVWLSKQDLSAKVVVFLDRSGYVSNTVFAKSSGNQQFDDYVLKTIRMAQPFGPPPEDLLDGGLTLGFPL